MENRRKVSGNSGELYTTAYSFGCYVPTYPSVNEVVTNTITKHKSHLLSLVYRVT
jgi:hypothetical protein